jgi:hypothetical protein
MANRITLFFRDVTDRVWSYLHTRDYHASHMDMLGTIINGMVLSPVEEMRAFQKKDFTPTGIPEGLWFHTLVLIFRTADDESRSFRIQTVDQNAPFFINGLVDTTHPDIVALADKIVTSVLCDERGVEMVEFLGGYWAFDDSFNQ